MRRTISDRLSPNSEAVRILKLARNAAFAAVERQERQTGSRMAAYEIVAQTVGTSASWLRKFISNSVEAKQPNLIVGWNILVAYRQICERVEQAAENERAVVRALQRQIDAVTTSTLGMVDGAARAAASPKAAEGIGEWLGPKSEKS